MSFRKIYVVLLLLLISCSSLISVIETTQTPFVWKRPQTQTYCLAQKPTFSLMGSEIFLQNHFYSFMTSLKKKENPTFIESAVLWTLVQMMARPDLSSPTARLQITLSLNNKINYFEFSSKTADQISYSYLYGLEKLLQYYHAPHSLSVLARWLDQTFPLPLSVEEEFGNVLAGSSNKFSASSTLQYYYFRADEVLKKDEHLPTFSFAKLIDLYEKEKNKNVNSNVIENRQIFQTTERGHSLSCNIDLKLYKQFLFSIAPNMIESHDFSLHDKEGNVFMASSSQSLTYPLKDIFSMPLFEGLQTAPGATHCFFENQTQVGDYLILVSTQERDPTQHLYHLGRGLKDIEDKESLYNHFKSARYLFLNNPLRVILESRRTTEQQRQELLKLNIPIYHSSSLGRLWGFLFNKKSFGLVSDDRYTAQVYCP